jgi:hypothetical protein
MGHINSRDVPSRGSKDRGQKIKENNRPGTPVGDPLYIAHLGDRETGGEKFKTVLSGTHRSRTNRHGIQKKFVVFF